MTDEKTKSKADRTGIIRAVETPLGFFVLIVLVVEAIFGVACGFATDGQRTYLIAAMILLIFSLVGIVASMAYCRPEALRGERFVPSPKPQEGQWEDSVIVDPKLFCVGTLAFEELGIQDDVAVLQSEFPGSVQLLRRATSDGVRDALTAARYDIVHLTGMVDRTSGFFIFGEQDHLRPEGLCNLIEVTEAKLVILATCDSLSLGEKLARITNMVAATRNVTIDDMINWEKCFYRLLAQGIPLSRAYDVATSTTNAPMVLMLRKDVTFSMKGNRSRTKPCT